MEQTREPASHHIVLIDDDEAIRSSIEFVLEDRGYSVESYQDGSPAFDSLKAGTRACLILLDMMMPMMNGWEFLKAIEALPHLAGVPVVAITASVGPIEGVPVVQVLRKPFNIQALFDICDRHCAHTAALA